MSKTVAVVLSGCGVFDGSEIHESVITLLSLARLNIPYLCMAPNCTQTKVVNHLTHEDMPNEHRNILVEAARIARGKIIDIKQANPNDYAAAIFPGGFGAAINLSDFGNKGAQCTINPDVLHFAQGLSQARKPMGFICIAPNLIPLIYGTKVQLTIGNDTATAQMLEQMGAEHVNCGVNAIVIDEHTQAISTPAYMLGQSPADIAEGIEKLVAEIAKRIC